MPRAIGRAINLSLRRARYHLRAVVVLAVVLALVAPFVFLAWHNTANQEVFFNQASEFVWQYPDGYTQKITVATGTGVVAMPISPTRRVTLRLWDRRVGYLVTEVPASWFYENARDWNGRSVNGW